MKAALREALQKELYAILEYWEKYTVDEDHGGFIGKLQNDNTPDPFAVKGAVLNARILWTFAAAYNATKEPRFLQTAQRAYDYIVQHFYDKEFGGVIWSVNYSGHPVETKKQVYAIAFTIYAFSEYYKATQDEYAKKLAIGLYSLIQLYSYDPVHGGYFEAFTRDWKTLDDQRLSAKDANEKKTMNTHLHVLEAYTTLYSIWPDAGLKTHITDLLKVFHDKILNHKTGHLQLFFNEVWVPKSTAISYGHDIEASWLLLEAAEAIAEPALVERFRAVAVKMAAATLKGLDEDGGLWYEYEPEHDNLIAEKHWWPQAEALVGFINAWQVSGDERYLQHAANSWSFIESHILNKAHGEWFWGVKGDKSVMDEDKVGLWKCPYHNGRACLEGMRRLSG